MQRHQDTFMKLEDIGNWYPKYQPTYDFDHDFIDSYHHFLATCPRKKGRLIQLYARYPLQSFLKDSIRNLLVDLRNLYRFGPFIPGWLLREEALKLYELSYYTEGEILELGSYRGLSTSILARACQASPYKKTILTVDLDPVCTMATLHNLQKMSLVRGIMAMIDDGTSAVQRLARDNRKFSLIFIDHSHTYQHTLEVCQLLPEITAPGAFCLFHDYNHPGNKDPSNKKIKVYQAVCDGLDPDRFEFYGIYGGAGLFRAK